MPPPIFVEKSSASGKFFSINSSHVFKDSRHTSDAEEFRHIVCFQIIAELAFCIKNRPRGVWPIKPIRCFFVPRTKMKPLWGISIVSETSFAVSILVDQCSLWPSKGSVICRPSSPAFFPPKKSLIWTKITTPHKTTEKQKNHMHVDGQMMAKWFFLHISASFFNFPLFTPSVFCEGKNHQKTARPGGVRTWVSKS